MIERHEVEALLTLAEELHFGRTAERLHITTARVSQTIRKLERQVGAPLFHRTSRRVELTPVGRTLVADVRPAWQAVGVAVQRAIDTGRGLSGSLSVAFVGAAAGQLLVGAAQVFRDRAPGCEVRIREAQASELVPWLRDGEVDLGLNTFPVHEPDIVCGPVLVREARMLAVPVGHPLARRGAVSVEDLARVPVLRLSDHAAMPSRQAERTPLGGPPVPPGPVAATFQEALTLVGAGQGVLPVGAHARRYHARPDVVYLPFSDAPPLEWGLMWPADRATARVRAFAEASSDLVRDHA
ncbi:LysR family transcriptional regulator [Kitasatospora kifunensis]|uniref:DNA-binding transcriptional LysR family regulator n=1 Tax=Kitasatospora kifunensis TaxID=58351 RepID=A0A7W7R9B1_KITKI|nr:LysR family transcriptional regulator [Kitasatospora kifunensis]MBB4927820.1 DNA-binding transcriptional LysR family regulator [Kitasatospora kifunensis]